MKIHEHEFHRVIAVTINPTMVRCDCGKAAERPLTQGEVDQARKLAHEWVDDYFDHPDSEEFIQVGRKRKL